MSRRTPTQEPLQFDKTDPWNADSVREAWEKRAVVDGDPKLAERLDDYVNRLTGVGDYNQDKTLGGSRYGLDFMVRFISSVDAENRWRGSDVGGRIIETIPAEMTREGWEIAVQPNEEDDVEEGAPDPTAKPAAVGDAFPNQGEGDAPPPGMHPGMMPPPKPEIPMPEVDSEGAEVSEAIEAKLEELRLDEMILQALNYERAYGGAAILMGAEDGLELDKPLDENNVKTLNWLNVFQGGIDGEIIAWSYYRDPRAPKYGEPELYMIRNIGVPISANPIGAMGAAPGRTTVVQPIMWVHESRLLIFPGKSPSRRARVQMRGWGDSVFTRIDEVLAQYSQVWGGLANLMTDFKQDVLGVEGNADKLAADKVSKGNPLLKRARAIQQTRSVVRMLVIDKDKETFTRSMATVTGVDGVLAQFWLRLATAADMPLSLLTGQVKGGLGDAGNTDIHFFFDRVASSQRRVIVPALKRLVRVLQLAKEGPTEGKLYKRTSVKCKPLYQLDALQEAQRRLTIAQTDQIYITQGVLHAPEVAASAFGGAEFSAERTIDFEGRKELADQEEADREARMKAAEDLMKNGPPAAPGEKPAAPGAKPPAPGAPPPPDDKQDAIRDLVECILCEGTGEDEDGDECPGCDGNGEFYAERAL